MNKGPTTKTHKTVCLLWEKTYLLRAFETYHKLSLLVKANALFEITSETYSSIPFYRKQVELRNGDTGKKNRQSFMLNPRDRRQVQW